MAAKKTFLGIMILAFLFGMIIVNFSSCDGRSALVGRWRLEEGWSDFHDVEFFRDGTGIVDGSGVNWKVERDRLIVTHPFMAIAWKFKVSGSTVTITDNNGEVSVFRKQR